jgi:hypothetical protein
MTTPRTALTSDDIPPGPLSEDDLRRGWNQQADEHNQWESLDSCKQLAWAQALAIKTDRHAAALKAEPEGEGSKTQPSQQQIDDLLAAISAAYSAQGWVPDADFICLFEEVARLAGIVEEGWDASVSPDDTKAKARAVLARRGPPSAGAAQPGESLATPPAPVPGEVPVAELDDQHRAAVHQAVAEALGSGAYACTRVWGAWQVGTMGPDDFVLVAEDSDRVAEIADAAIEAILANPAPQAGDPSTIATQP